MSRIPTWYTISPSSDPVVEFFHAINQDDVDKVSDLLNQQQFDLNYIRDEDGRAPLMVAAIRNRTQVLEFLANCTQVDLELRDNEGNTALYKGCATGATGAVECLLRAGANVDAENREQSTPLIIAAYNGHSSLCSFLVGFGHANINHRDVTHKTALSFASFEGHDETVEALLERGAEVDCVDKFGWSALMLAAHAGKASVVQKLVDYGADTTLVTDNGKTAEDLAREAGRLAIVQILSECIVPNIASKRPTIPTPIPFSVRPKSRILSREHGSSTLSPFSSVLSENRSTVVGSPNSSATLTDRLTPQQNELSIDYLKSHNYRSFSQKPISPEYNVANERPVTTSMMKPIKPLGEFSWDQSQWEDLSNEKSDWNIKSPIPIKLHRRQSHSSFENQRPLIEPEIRRRRPPQAHVSNNISTAGGQDNSTDSRRLWEIASKLLTCCCLNHCLIDCGKLTDPDVRQAWREKVSLCIIIFLISSFLGFLTFTFSTVVCRQGPPIFAEDVAHKYGFEGKGMQLMVVRGRLYNVKDYFRFGYHRPILPFADEDLASVVNPLLGQDISEFFPIDKFSSKCRKWPLRPSCAFEGSDKRYHCHSSPISRKTLESLSIHNFVAFSWESIQEKERKLFVYNDKVFSLDLYLYNNETYLGDSHFTSKLLKLIGRDATRDIIRDRTLKAVLPCFEDQLLVGMVEGSSTGCFASNLLIVVSSVILVGIILIKFVSAVAFDWFLSRQLGKITKKSHPSDPIKPIILLVTCYSEGEHSIRTTLDSLALTSYDDEYKLLFVICDGDIVGAGNEKSTPNIVLDIIEPFDSAASIPEPASYIAVGDGAKQHNMAQVYIGFYRCQGHRVPILVVVKCGTPNEKDTSKAGNRGKRDSQLILMQWLSKICLNEKMTPLEYELFEKVRILMNFTPDQFEMVLMVDADTLVEEESVSRMVAAMERDSNVMGLCGETKVANKKQTWVTMIQVYEYYISHHLGKAFESIFGGVTCLPGCFCMYRIKAPKCNDYSVPVLANPEIVELYSSNDVSTLHQKNLLLLGEDRYLTTLMLRTFPKRKMIYVPKAICRTVVPDEFRVLLSQRRRWINSTVHNLLELILVPQLCGIFCCSMQFVILLELLGTVIMPASFVFFLFLILAAFTGADVWLPLIFMCIVFFLQTLLIAITTRKMGYVLWMFVFILAMPIWNFALPIYAFWHFDDFSWGTTRKIDGLDSGHGGERDFEQFDPSVIPTKHWHEWSAENRDSTSEDDENPARPDSEAEYFKRNIYNIPHQNRDLGVINEDEIVEDVVVDPTNHYNRYALESTLRYPTTNMNKLPSLRGSKKYMSQRKHFSEGSYISEQGKARRYSRLCGPRPYQDYHRGVPYSFISPATSQANYPAELYHSRQSHYSRPISASPFPYQFHNQVRQTITPGEYIPRMQAARSLAMEPTYSFPSYKYPPFPHAQYQNSRYSTPLGRPITSNGRLYSQTPSWSVPYQYYSSPLSSRTSLATTAIPLHRTSVESRPQARLNGPRGYTVLQPF
ncbi:ATP-dependent RNA helicase [Basidiobolus ranarum]|uniref:chitin synthase n=1 Tax=Basidiobolus ranarum TaxID=34480 RepID=A0ABR2WWY8_9FUNG